MDAVQPNTAIAKLMVWARDIAKDAPVPRAAGDAFLRMLSPFAPHLAEELWARLGHAREIALEAWPVADASLLVADTIQLPVQVNGKLRDTIDVAASAGEDAIRAAALAAPNVVKHLAGRAPKKVIVIAGRLVNVVG
jgi:leucyl-tRNA synthetase